jgi:nicotinate-nucleotide adenylyltransferase
MAAQAARRFQAFRRPEQAAGRLAITPPPAWTFMHHRLNPISATEIRARRANGGRNAAAKSGS